MSQTRIHLSPPHLSGDEQRYLADAVASNWIAPVGPYLRAFERRMSEVVGVEHAVAVNSGTSALHLALRHLGLQPGDEVLCSTLTFCASANPICYEGATPVFIDCEPDTGNIDPNLLEDELQDCAARGQLPKAVVAVDLFGQSVDMDAILDIANRYDVPVIEDSAEALGSTYRGNHVGAQAWASLFSFNGNKILTTSGGGVLCSNDAALIDHARHLASQAREPAAHYQHNEIGFNYRMSNLLAAVGVAQLDVLYDRVAARRRNWDYYRTHLGDLPGVTMIDEAPGGRSNRWLSAILIDADEFGANRETIRRALAAEQIESRRVWKPLHLQPSFAGCRVRGGAAAERLFHDGLCLPSGSAMTAADLQRVVTCVLKSHHANRRPQRVAA